MRILQIVHYYPPETFGGTQGYVADLCASLVAGGHQVQVVAGSRKSSSDGAIDDQVEKGVPVRRILRDLPAEALSGDFGSERIGSLVEESVVEFDPDLIHVHHWQALTRDLVRRMKAKGYPVMLTLHDLFTSCPRFFRMPDARRFCESDVGFSDCARCVSADAPGLSLGDLEAFLAHRFGEFQAELEVADVVLTVSDAQRHLLQSLPKFSFAGLRTLPIGIPVPVAPPTAEASQIAGPPSVEPVAGRLRIVNWAGLDPRKGIHLIVEAVAGSTMRDAFEIHLHGRDGEQAYMDEIRSKGVGLNLHFHGPFEDEERLSFASRYDLAVFPFLAFETYGLVVDEALHSGIPVLVSDHGAPPERLGASGLVFDNGDVMALRARLEELCQTPAMLNDMREGSHHARTLPAHIAELGILYDQIATGC